MALTLCFAAGCSGSMLGRKRESAVEAGPTTATASAPTVQFLGTVHVIGTQGRFVLVQSPVATLVAGLTDGEALVCRAAGNPTAALRVSRERRPPFVVADVVSGTPNVGDEVFIEPAGVHASVPPTPASAPEFRANPGLPSGR